MKRKVYIIFRYSLLLAATASISMKGLSQAPASDSIRLDYRKIYSLALDGDARSALAWVDKDTLHLSQKDKEFEKAFDERFRYAEDHSRFPDSSSALDGLLAIYKPYWRRSVLNPTINGDSAFKIQVAGYLSANYPPAAGLGAGQPSTDSIDHYLVPYLASLNLHTTGFGKVGRLFDLLVWKHQRDTVYTIVSHGDTTRTSVRLMTDFISLGWEAYATLGRHYPSGWATSTSLFCVEQAYDLHSETFLVSYLAHEGWHFSDYKLFPRLKSTDLEYRAKMKELSMADTTLMHLIDFFSSNANFDSGNGHSVANYCAIRDLSRALFHNDFEKDMNKWKQLPTATINAAAAKILKENTRILETQGKEVTSYIKKETLSTTE
jgi:hypothetical protein